MLPIILALALFYITRSIARSDELTQGTIPHEATPIVTADLELTEEEKLYDPDFILSIDLALLLP